jgi:putative ABC transport system ATP-binding protein
MTTPLLCATDLQRRHGETVVFAQVNLTVQAGEFVAVVGDSGVGKSTLLNALAGLERLDGGAVHLQGQRVDTLPEEAQALLRREHLGFVFQAFHVLPHLSVRQNVALPLMLLQRPDAARVQQVLDALGLGSLGERLPQQLSGGQLQRVAIARALVHRPRLILADEPTGNLDPDTAAQVMQALRQQTREQGAACVMVTHSPAAAALADRVLRLTRQGLSPEVRPT